MNGGASKDFLPTQAELLDDRQITVGSSVLQIIEQAPTLGHKLEKSASGRVVLDMTLEMFRKFVDAFRQQRDLNVCAAGVLFVKPEVFDFDAFFSHCILCLFLNRTGLHAHVALARKVFPSRDGFVGGQSGPNAIPS